MTSSLCVSLLPISFCLLRRHAHNQNHSEETELAILAAVAAILSECMQRIHLAREVHHLQEGGCPFVRSKLSCCDLESPFP